MRLLPVLFSIALFGAALLSFSVQPILGKMLLPMVGGAPAGWIVAMAFFQTALLAGYGISYGLSRFTPWIHAAGLLALYTAGLFFLPPAMPVIGDQLQGLALSIAVVKALAHTILLPYLALTATTSALQRVFAATAHPTARDPYYLFIASNIGSFAGLLAYPFLLEPFSGLTFQAHSWQLIYGLVVALILAACGAAWALRRQEPWQQNDIRPSAPPSFRQVFQWLILAFIPCSLSMGVTTLITTDMAGVPLFWIIPLGLYLLTFVLAFARRPLLPLKKLQGWQLNAIGFLLLIMAIGLGFKPGGNIQLFIFFTFILLEVFFVTAWTCHQLLAGSRPDADRLALFYFILALGGGLAGIVHAFILPFVLHDVIEFPIVVLVSLMLHPEFRATIYTPRLLKLKVFFVPCTGIAILAIAALSVMKKIAAPEWVYGVTIVIFAGSFLIISGRPRLLFFVGLAILIASTLTRYPGQVLETGRNFFGAHVIYDKREPQGMIRYFVHGNTLHGLEVLDKKNEANRYHSAYYSRGNAIADVLAGAKAKSWAVIGLGSGQLACYEPSLTTDFYEIDPQVEKIARHFFSYLEECPPRDVLLGDGRLQLKNRDRRYDVLLLDAFTSDGIPMHLLTAEALVLYQSRLNKGGMILFHTSNRYLELAPPIAAAARTLGLTTFTILDRVDKKYPLAKSARWVAVPLSPAGEIALAAKGWETVAPADRAWTDDRSSLLSAFVLQPRMQ